MPAVRKPETAPPDLDKESRRLWATTLGWLESKDLWDSIDSGALERYVRSVERGRVARGEFGDRLTASGSQGQLVQHPSVKTAREAERDAHEYAKELCLTPLARKRHEVGKDQGDDPLDGRV